MALHHVVRAFALCCAFSLAIPTVASATTVVALSRDELTAQSDLIVRASVVSQRSGWNDDHSQIVTWTRLRVAEYLKGSGATELVLRQFGGTVDGMTSEIPGDARLVVGQHAVLFLRQGPSVVFLTALSQAAYVVTINPDDRAIVRRDLTGLSFARWEGGRMVSSDAPRDAVETLEHIVRDVRAIALRSR
jgi:hypothetical protein